MPCTVDREALLIEQVADPTDQQDFVMLVIAPIAAPLDWLQLRKLLLPVAKHVRLDGAQIADLANREITLGGDRGKGSLSSAGFGHGSPLRPWPSTSGSRET